MDKREVETWGKLTLAGITVFALFLVIGSGNWGADAGFAPTERSNSAYDDFATELFVRHGFELVLVAVIIAAAVLGGLQIAREEEYD